MFFGERLKEEREKRGWSQVDLAEKIHVSRQSVSKWETGKNHPSIEMIIDLSDLLEITIDELLRNDKNLEEKIVKDSRKRKYLSEISSPLFSGGILLGIILVSLLKNGEINWVVLGITMLMLISLSCLNMGVQRVKRARA